MISSILFILGAFAAWGAPLVAQFILLVVNLLLFSNAGWWDETIQALGIIATMAHATTITAPDGADKGAEV